MSSQPENRSTQEWVEELAALHDEEAFESFLARHPHLLDAAVVEDLCDQIPTIVRQDMRKATSLVRAARWLADSLGNDYLRGRSDRALANVHHSSGEWKKAQRWYDAAISKFEDLGMGLEVAITKNSGLVNLAYLGEYDRVYAWEHSALDEFVAHNDRARIAALDNNVAGILTRQGRWEEALTRFTAAYEESVLLGNSQVATITLRNIAACQIALHRFTEAQVTYKQSRDYCVSHGLTRLLHEVDYNIAYLHYLKGEYTKAIQLYQATRRVCDEAGDTYHRALCDLDHAELCVELNLVEEARLLSQAAFVTFDQLEMPYEKAKSLINLAVALSRQRQTGQALDHLSRARQMFEEEHNDVWIAMIDLYRGSVLFGEGRFFESLAAVTAARLVFLEFSLPSKSALCELLLAQMHLRNNELPVARKWCQRALRHIEDLDLPSLEYQTYYLLAKTAESRGDRDQAYDYYATSQTKLERLRSHLQGDSLKIAFFDDKQGIYESLIALSLTRVGSPERQRQAFELIEKAKSRSLADQLAFRSLDLQPRSPHADAKTRHVRSLREELNYFYRQIDRQQLSESERSPERIESVRREIREREAELQRRLGELQVMDREYGSIQMSATLKLEQIQTELASDTTLLNYFVARGTVYVAIVSPGRYEVVPVSPAKRVVELQRLLQFQFSKFGLGKEYTSKFSKVINEATRSHLRDLYRELIAPVVPYLKTGHLVIVPHRFLHYLPFHAMLDGDTYLIDRYAISYAPSATVFNLCCARPPSDCGRALVMGVADDSAPYIRDEVQVVAGALPRSRLLTGEDATVEALRSEGRGCRVVHIATHANFRSDNPMFSSIQLAKSRLSLFDLYSLRLDAELIVLSGCGTGLSVVKGADEIVGLTRGLLYAGASAAVVSLWNVHDRSSAEFMRIFYDNLGNSLEPSKALRQTMTDLRRTYPHPYYWAPFVLVGRAG
jgi:CHAT domain-containing protein/Tfp pilus assembly protein PilF